MERELALEFVRVTEAAALSSGRLMGRGDKKAADRAAVESMRRAFDTVYIDGVVVKIPMNIEGLKAVSCLERNEEIRCNVTLVFSVNQALLAARAGASYISPFVGRIDDIGWDGIGLIREMVTVFERQKLASQVIAASIRHPLHVQESAAAGSHIATLPFSVLKQMASHPLTDQGIERFLADWGKVKNKEQ